MTDEWRRSKQRENVKAQGYYGTKRWWADQLALGAAGVAAFSTLETGFAWLSPPPGWSNPPGLTPGIWFGWVSSLFLVQGTAVLGILFLTVIALRWLLPKLRESLRRPFALLLFLVTLGLPTGLILSMRTLPEMGSPESITGLAAGIAVWLAVGFAFKLPGQSPLPILLTAACAGLALGMAQLAIPVLVFAAAFAAWILAQRGEPVAGGWLLLLTSAGWTWLITEDLFRPNVPLANYGAAGLGWLGVAAGAFLIASSLLRRGPLRV